MKKIRTGSANGLPFDKMYWEDMYAEDDESYIDGVFNAKHHARYCKTFFELFDCPSRSIGDFGYGLGDLLREFVKVFRPERIIGTEPSEEAFQKLTGENWPLSAAVAFYPHTIQDFPDTYLRDHPLDLIICNSVFQYIPDSGIEPSFEKMHRLSRFLYFTVPTEKDYRYMKRELNFTDPYAYSRKLSFYRKEIRKYYSFISHNILESKHFQNSSHFSFELYRY